MSLEPITANGKPCQDCLDEVDAFTLLRTDLAQVKASQRRFDQTLWRIETGICLVVLLLLIRNGKLYGPS